jgi:hypothetical protein
MSLLSIDFQQASNLTDPARWVYDPDKDITPGSALKHLLVEQVTEEKAAVTGYCAGRVWIQRKTDSRGFITSKYLFDGEDLITRVSKLDIWKRHALRISQNNTNSMRLDCVQQVDDQNKVVSIGNINVATYAGDIADFNPPDISTFEQIAHCTESFDLRHAARVCSDFSGLRGDTAKRAAWFCVEEESVRINVTERASNRGVGLLTYRVESGVLHEMRFGIEGRYLQKACDVFKATNFTGISVDSLENPTQVCFYGDAGWVVMPVIDGYYCGALSQGAMGIFLGEDYTLERKAVRIFQVEELVNALSIQTPKKGATRNDVVLEFKEQLLEIHKRSDIRKTESSSVATAVLATEPAWVPVVVDHTYFSDALDALDSFLTHRLKQTPEITFGFYPEEAAEDGTEEENRKAGDPAEKLVALTQAFCPQYKNWILLVEPAEQLGDSPCRASLVLQTKQETNVNNEED